MTHSTVLTNAQQGKATLDKLWQWLKPRLIAGHRVVLTVGEETRSLEQNSALHAALSDVAKQVEWANRKWDVTDWKRLLTAAWMRAEGQSAVVVPAVDGAGIDVLYRHTSKMSKAEVSSLLDYIHAWGAEHDVRFTAPEEA